MSLYEGVIFGGFLYIAGGERYNNSMAPLNTVFRFDPRSGAWLKVASMKHNRQSFNLAVLNNMMYAVGKYSVFCTIQYESAVENILQIVAVWNTLRNKFIDFMPQEMINRIEKLTVFVKSSSSSSSSYMFEFLLTNCI